MQKLEPDRSARQSFDGLNAFLQKKVCLKFNWPLEPFLQTALSISGAAFLLLQWYMAQFEEAVHRVKGSGGEASTIYQKSNS